MSFEVPKWRLSDWATKDKSPQAVTDGHPLRYFMLFLFAYNSFLNAMLWITFAPVSSAFKEYYGVGDLALNSMSILYMAVFILFGPFAAAVIQSFSLRRGLLIGLLLNTLGAAIRILPAPFKLGNPGVLGFIFCFIGQTSCSFAQTFILGTPSVIAQNWFPPQERVTSTSIGFLANQAGAAIAFLKSPAIVGDDSERVLHLILVEVGMCVAGLAMVWFFFESKPTPLTVPTGVDHSVVDERQPSPAPIEVGSAGSDDRSKLNGVGDALAWRSILRTNWGLLHNRDFLLVFLAFGFEVGIFYTFATLLDQSLQPLGYTSTETGYMGFALLMVGLSGAILFGWLADRLHNKHGVLSIICAVGQGVALLWFSQRVAEDRLHELIAASCLMGFFMTAILAVLVDFGVQLATPVHEMISATLVLISAQSVGILMIVVLGSTLTCRTCAKEICAILAALSWLGAVLLFFCRSTYSSTRAETAQHTRHSSTYQEVVY